jgi:hypothetical protein
MGKNESQIFQFCLSCSTVDGTQDLVMPGKCSTGQVTYSIFAFVFCLRQSLMTTFASANFELTCWDYRVAFQCRLQFNLKCRLWHWLRKIFSNPDFWSIFILCSSSVDGHMSFFCSVIITNYTLFTF